jgi:hypothetical protein
MTRTIDRIEHRQSPLTRYRSLASFYAADPRRVRSRELDVGLWWREDAGGPLHRAAWVSDTGELYLVRLGPSQEGGGEVEVLATVAERERLESVLEGWREQCGAPCSLTWLREHVSRRAPDVRESSETMIEGPPTSAWRTLHASDRGHRPSANPAGPRLALTL